MQLVIPKLLAELIYDPNNERKVLEKPWLLIRELYPKIQDAIRATAYTMGIVNECEFDDFVFNNCMFTIVGFWLSDQHLITFRAGDGIIFINSEANTYVQPQNVPFYLGHTLLSDNDPRKVREVEAVFEIKRYPRQGFIRVLVATDGLNPALNFLAKTVWTCRNELDLKSKLIMLFNQQITYDDTAVVFALLEEVA